MVNKKVSIIMPAYNCENTIEEAIESVINQTYKDWELIVINDCSSDNTQVIVEEYENKNNRIKVFKNEQNLGVAETRNKAISLAKTEWIAFLDSDDIWGKEKLNVQMEYIKNKNVRFVFTGSSYINEKGDKLPGVFEVPEEVDYNLLKKQNVISCSSILIKRSLLKNIKMPNGEMHEDYATWLKVLKTGIKAHGINKPLLTYRLSPKSKSGNKIKSFDMSYRVFRYIGLNKVQSVIYTITHLYNAFRKYRRIYSV